MVPISVVYKQWYKSKNLSSTAVLNAKHLKYIACRKGSIFNQGCGFGLWGRTTDERAVQNINNLKESMSLVSEVSKEHTIYRSILSLPEETALEKGYEGRTQWQELVSGNMDTVAKEMDVELKHFRWCASYHHEKGHPHVHLIFWDNSDKVRMEHIPAERFEIMSEKIRSAFNKTIYQTDLSELFSQQNISKKELREQSKNYLDCMGELIPIPS